MTFRVALPSSDRSRSLDVIDPMSTAVQRALRRHGLAGYEPSTMAAALAELEGAGPALFVDVGANIGLYAHVVGALFDQVRAVAIEPTPNLADWARRIAAANSLDTEVRELALSDTDGQAELFLADASDVSNSLEPGFKASSAAVAVELRRLDTIVGESLGPPHMMKIDVEGHESAVLRGARQTLESVKPTMLVEVLSRRGGRLSDEINEALDGLGYACYELGAAPDWQRHDRVARRDVHRDWLLRDTPIGDDFIARWSRWRSLIDDCTGDRNSRVPALRTASAVFQRGGVREVVSALRRYIGSAGDRDIPATSTTEKPTE